MYEDACLYVQVVDVAELSSVDVVSAFGQAPGL